MENQYALPSWETDAARFDVHSSEAAANTKSQRGPRTRPGSPGQLLCSTCVMVDLPHGIVLIQAAMSAASKHHRPWPFSREEEGMDSLRKLCFYHRATTGTGCVLRHSGDPAHSVADLDNNYVDGAVVCRCLSGLRAPLWYMLGIVSPSRHPNPGKDKPARRKKKKPTGLAPCWARDCNGCQGNARSKAWQVG